MPALHPDQLVVREPGGSSGFSIAIAAEAPVTFDRDRGRKLVVERSRSRREQARVGTVHATDNGKNIVIPDVEGVNQVRAEDVIPVAAVGEVIVGLPVTFARDLLRKNVLAVSERSEI